MFCGKCGKKVNDDMLFCPFCGNAIVVPDQDDDAEITNKYDDSNRPVSESGKRKLISLFDEDAYKEEKSEEFVPLSEDKDYREADSESEDETVIDDTVEDFAANADDDFIDPYDETIEDDPYDDEPMGPEDQDAPRMNRKSPTSAPARRGSYIPVRDVKSEDMFLGTEDDEYDDYDDYDDDFADDEKPEKGFLKRHLAGLIAIAVTVMIIAGIGAYTLTGSGQKLLAKLNLAWKADAYARVGMDMHNDGDYAEAANYYMRALNKDSVNYEYAHSAMVSYYNAGDIEHAAQLAIKCINLNPEDPEPYRELRTIYGNGDIPAIARDYIQQGYQKTGDEYLNPANWLKK